MITNAQALDHCRSQPGFSAADCDEWLKVHSVNGQFCDGDVLSTKPDPNGPIVRRCVSTQEIERKLQAEKNNPLPGLAQRRQGPSSFPWIYVGGAAALLAAIYFVAR
jgi:hypothetical protein